MDPADDQPGRAFVSFESKTSAAEMLNGASEATWREDGGLLFDEREVAGLALARREAVHAHPFVASNIAPNLEKGSQ